MAPRFAGVPVEQATQATGTKPRFAGVPVAAPSSSAQNPYFADLPIPGTMNKPAPAADAPKPFNETAFAQGTSGLNEGIANVLGLPVDLTQGALRLGAAGINAATGSNIQLPVDAIGGSQSIKSVMAPAIRPDSEDPTNKVVRRIGQEIGSSLVPAGGVIARSATPIRAAVGQLATATGSGAAAGVAQQLTDNPYVEMAAQILGGGAVVGATMAGRKAITPFTIDPERQAVNATLAREGVELTPGQMTGNDRLKYAESEIGGGAAANLTARQQEQFTQAALSRAGISATRATPEVMDAAFTDIGRTFDDLAARHYVAPDAQLGQDIGAVIQEYQSLVPETARAPVVEGLVRDVVQAIQTGPIPGAGPNALTAGPVSGVISGEAYKSLRSRLNRMARKSTDPELQDALFGIQQALDGAMERTLQQISPEDLGAWRQVRADYRNLLVLEQAASRAGEATAMGIITPANLRSAVTQQSKRSYVRGHGDFAELARAGVAGMTPLPNSGTAGRLAARGMAAGIPATLGALAGNNVGGGLGAMAGFAAGTFAPNALGAIMMSPAGRRYLTNQAMPGPVNALQMAGAPAIGMGANALSALRTNAFN